MGGESEALKLIGEVNNGPEPEGQEQMGLSCIKHQFEQRSLAYQRYPKCITALN